MLKERNVMHLCECMSVLVRVYLPVGSHHVSVGKRLRVRGGLGAGGTLRDWRRMERK